MADSEEVTLGPPADPDLSDLAMVIVNVQTKSGEQFSMMMEANDGQLKMEMEDEVDLDPHTQIRVFRVIGKGV